MKLIKAVFVGVLQPLLSLFVVAAFSIDTQTCLPVLSDDKVLALASRTL